MEIRYSQFQSALPTARSAAKLTSRYEIDNSEIKTETINNKTQNNRQKTLTKILDNSHSLTISEKGLPARDLLTLTRLSQAENEAPENYQSNKAIKTYNNIYQQKNEPIQGDLISRIDRYV